MGSEADVEPTNGHIDEKAAHEHEHAPSMDGKLNGHDTNLDSPVVSSDEHDEAARGSSKVSEPKVGKEGISDTEESESARDDQASEGGTPDGSTEDEDSEESDEDDDDYEPALKYDLLGGATESLLEKDSASALAVSPKYLVSFCLVALSTLFIFHRLWEPMVVLYTSSTTPVSASSHTDRTPPQ